jgi:hypothetical protein
VHKSDAPLVASAAILNPTSRLRVFNHEWQRDVWDFYESLGTFKYAMLWHSQTMSRVRITAGLLRPGAPIPEPVTEGTAAELMADFFGGTQGQSEYMRSMDIQLQCPGEGYVVVRPDRTQRNEWCVKSSDELRVTSGRAQVNGRRQTVDLWEVLIDEGVWETLPYESLVFRQWNPDDRFHFRANSPARAALNDMRIISMIQKRIVAQSVSRLASNGLLLYPQEVTFPAKAGYENAEDPFTAEWLDIAQKTIANPGSASAAIPLPIKVPREYIKDFVHMDFSNTYDEKIMEVLGFFYDRLATAMNMPKEVVSGMGDTSHWNAWSLDEQGIEVHIKPPAESMMGGVTKGYLHPAMMAAGEPPILRDGSQYVAWYDTSTMDVPADRSTAADQAFDRQAINLAAYRNAKGFAETDKPDDKQLREQLLLKMAMDPTQAPVAIAELTGTPVAGASTGPGGVDTGPPSSQPTPATGPPQSQPTGPGQPPEGVRRPQSQ